MGGYGSGRRPQGKTVGECGCLELSSLLKRCRREGITAGRVTWFNTATAESGVSIDFHLEAGHLGPLLRVSYGVDGKTIEQPVALQTSRPHLGGERWWMTCPSAVDGRPCRRRVAKLYLSPGASLFACRICHKLTYPSCRASHRWDQLIRRAGWTVEEGLERLRQAMDRKSPRRKQLASGQRR
jgi:hypothetical protein